MPTKFQLSNKIFLLSGTVYALSFLLTAVDFNTDMVGMMRGWKCAWSCVIGIAYLFDGSFWGLFGTGANAMALYVIVAEYRSWSRGMPIPARLWPGQAFVLAAIGSAVAWQFFDSTADLMAGHYLWAGSIVALTVGYSLRRLPLDRIDAPEAIQPSARQRNTSR